MTNAVGSLEEDEAVVNLPLLVNLPAVVNIPLLVDLPPMGALPLADSLLPVVLSQRSGALRISLSQISHRSWPP